jgi:phage anti-repressor protein
MELIKQDNKLYVSGKQLHTELGMKRRFANWIIESIERADLKEGTDFVTQMLPSTGGRPLKEYQLTRDAALCITMMSGGKFANSLRNKVIELYNQHDTGLSFNTQQIEALMDLSRAMTLISIQKEVESKHFYIYDNPQSWYKHRAALLGYNTSDVIEAMRKINKKHKTMRASMIQLDSNELIRVGVIDFMLAMGKTKEYATNAGNLCKSIASKMELGNIIWDDTKPNPLQINEQDVLQRKVNYKEAKTLLN